MQLYYCIKKTRKHGKKKYANNNNQEGRSSWSVALFLALSRWANAHSPAALFTGSRVGMVRVFGICICICKHAYEQTVLVLLSPLPLPPCLCVCVKRVALLLLFLLLLCYSCCTQHIITSKYEIKKCDVIAKKRTQFVDLTVQEREREPRASFYFILIVFFLRKLPSVSVSKRAFACVWVCVCVFTLANQEKLLNQRAYKFLGVKALWKYQSNDKINNDSNNNNTNQSMQWRMWTQINTYICS